MASCVRVWYPDCMYEELPHHSYELRPKTGYTLIASNLDTLIVYLTIDRLAGVVATSEVVLECWPQRRNVGVRVADRDVAVLLACTVCLHVTYSCLDVWCDLSHVG